MAEGGVLLRRLPRKRHKGSNPFSTARFIMEMWQSGLLRLLGKQVELKDSRRFKSFYFRQFYNGVISLMVKSCAVNAVVVGSNPTLHPKFKMVSWQSGLMRCPAKTFAAKAARGFESHIYRQFLNGSVAEWFIALVLKTSEQKCSVGSNPTASASITMVVLA